MPSDRPAQAPESMGRLYCPWVRYGDTRALESTDPSYGCTFVLGLGPGDDPEYALVPGHFSRHHSNGPCVQRQMSHHRLDQHCAKICSVMFDALPTLLSASASYLHTCCCLAHLVSVCLFLA